MRSRFFKILTLAAVSLLVFQTPASADTIRYDVSFESEYIGYMLFGDVSPDSGNLWPYIKIWSLNFDGYDFNSSNTLPSSISYFAVDKNYILLIDDDPPCFFSGSFCNDGTSLSFSANMGFLLLKDDSANFYDYRLGELTYSPPIFVVPSIPATPGLTLLLLGIALVSVVALYREDHILISRG